MAARTDEALRVQQVVELLGVEDALAQRVALKATYCIGAAARGRVP